MEDSPPSCLLQGSKSSLASEQAPTSKCLVVAVRQGARANK
jgi:hypothetical protein